MSDYLLPCTCGKKIGVTKSQAGQTVRCTCGTELEVPTLRNLSELERVGTRGVAKTTTWTNRHRLVFSLAIVALAGVLAAGYLARIRALSSGGPAVNAVRALSPRSRAG